MEQPHSLDFLNNTFVNLQTTSIADIQWFLNGVEFIGYEIDNVDAYVQGDCHYLTYSDKVGFCVCAIDTKVDSKVMNIELYMVLIYMANPGLFFHKGKPSTTFDVLIDHIKEKQEEGLPLIDFLEAEK